MRASQDVLKGPLEAEKSKVSTLKTLEELLDRSLLTPETRKQATLYLAALEKK